MPFPIEKKLVIAVTCSSIFNMAEGDAIFRNDGEIAYRKYQHKNLDEPLSPGVAFPFVQRLLKINDRFETSDAPIEVVVLSRNDPESGRRFFRSCRHYNLAISRGAFLTGTAPYKYVKAFSASIFLSANEEDVLAAMSNKIPAGLVLGIVTEYADDDQQLRIAFDFDGVIVDDESEIVYQENKDIGAFYAHEVKNMGRAHEAGPLADLFQRISIFQRTEKEKQKADKDYRPPIKISIVTARNSPANERLVSTLSQWRVEPDEVFLMGGIEKKRVLDVLRPHIFFDDQISHLTPVKATIPSVHIPFGIANSGLKTH